LLGYIGGECLVDTGVVVTLPASTDDEPSAAAPA
jgi:hypothetical protein